MKSTAWMVGFVIVCVDVGCSRKDSGPATTSTVETVAPMELPKADQSPTDIAQPPQSDERLPPSKQAVAEQPVVAPVDTIKSEKPISLVKEMIADSGMVGFNWDAAKRTKMAAFLKQNYDGKLIRFTGINSGISNFDDNRKVYNYQIEITVEEPIKHGERDEVLRHEGFLVVYFAENQKDLRQATAKGKAIRLEGLLKVATVNDLLLCFVMEARPLPLQDNAADKGTRATTIPKTDDIKVLEIDPKDLAAVQSAVENKRTDDAAVTSAVVKYDGKLVSWSGQVTSIFEDRERKCHGFVVTKVLDLVDGRLKLQKRLSVTVYLKDEKTEEKIVASWGKDGKNVAISLESIGRMKLKGPFFVQLSPRFGQTNPGYCLIENAEAEFKMKAR